jgi:hypothetical protein
VETAGNEASRSLRWKRSSLTVDDFAIRFLFGGRSAAAPKWRDTL